MGSADDTFHSEQQSSSNFFLMYYFTQHTTFWKLHSNIFSCQQY